MKQFLTILAICMITNAVKSQNVFPTTTGSNVGIGTTTPGSPLEVNANDVSDSLLVATFFGPNNTGVGAATKLRFGAINSKGNSAEWRYIHRGNDSAGNRLDFGFRSYTNPVFTYTRSGNFGIGTTAPAYLLDVNGGSRLGGSNNLISGINITKGTGSNRGNIGIGDGVFRSITSGSQSTIIGDSAYIANTTGSNNNAFGYWAMQSNLTGNSNTAAGSFTMRDNTSGSSNSAFGYSALRFNVSGSNNVAIGHQAGRFIANGSSNLTGTSNSIYIGSESKGLNNSDNNSIVIGYNAIGIGANSVVLGNSSIATTALRGNIGIGTTAPTAQLHSTGTVRFAGLVLSDTASRILVSDTSGKVAYRSMSVLNTGWSLTGNFGTNPTTNFIGTTDSQRLVFKTNNIVQTAILPNGNMGIGNQSPIYKLDVTGTGRFTNDVLVNGITLGLGAGSGSNNTIFGSGSGAINTTGAWNSFLGAQSGNLNTTGYANSFFGGRSGYSNSSGFENSFLGYQSGYSNTTGYQNVFVGSAAGYLNTTGNANIFVGPNVGYSNTTGTQNIFVGLSAGNQNSTGAQNTFIGIAAGRYNTSGNTNCFFGTQAGQNTITGSQNNFFGASAGMSNTTGAFNNFYGTNAGSNTTTGNNNNFMGVQAGIYNTTGTQNVFIGGFSGFGNTIANNNIGIGAYAGENNTTGASNIFFGINAGRYIANGTTPATIVDNSLLLGTGTKVQANNQVNQVVIGYNSTGLGSNTTVLGNTSTATTAIYGNLLLGTTLDSGYRLNVTGTGRFTGDVSVNGNVGIGTNLITDTAYKLFVEKGIRTRKVKVDALTWADYVFDKDYKLPTLAEVDKFIQQNNHLPGVLSKVEVEKNGIDIGENQAMLLKKVEELTLYLIDLDKKVKQLSTENEQLKKKITGNNQ